MRPTRSRNRVAALQLTVVLRSFRQPADPRKLHRRSGCGVFLPENLARLTGGLSFPGHAFRGWRRDSPQLLKLHQIHLPQFRILKAGASNIVP